jgi:hypothetical protein
MYFNFPSVVESKNKKKVVVNAMDKSIWFTLTLTKTRQNLKKNLQATFQASKKEGQVKF